MLNVNDYGVYMLNILTCFIYYQQILNDNQPDAIL